MADEPGGDMLIVIMLKVIISIVITLMCMDYIDDYINIDHGNQQTLIRRSPVVEGKVRQSGERCS